MVLRYYTEKKVGFDVEANAVLREAREFLGLNGVTAVRLFNRYDIEGVAGENAELIRAAVLSEAAVDVCYAETLPVLPNGAFRLAIEPLPGQYDQRADSCAQCVEMITRGERPAVRTAKVYVFDGTLTDAEKNVLRRHLINPVESREASPDKPETLRTEYPEPQPVPVLRGFTDADGAELKRYISDYGLAMDADDLAFMRQYFRDEKRRDPTLTELRLIDTYWSDHCRHTTFLTSLENVSIGDPEVKAAFDRYMALRREVYGDTARPVTLMDVATIAAKTLRKRGLLQNLDISDEVNACSIHIDVEINGKTEDWLLLFKNETHNHPTEVEPFGGAATCIGGAIRDPLSGRGYVFQAMRVTGSGDPRVPLNNTLHGKLPQRRLTTTAAHGYSSYGNQIGLATGLVHEFYHPGYVAKRMEIGAVVGAVKFENVRRETPAPGDVVLLLGGRTGRDGIGGATGSSKSHDSGSVVNMASEVQKGNAPEERKLQRLFRDASVLKMIKRCNDFGAGGVSVAIGELADGLDIDLSKVRKKYEGLDATELAISESQERMAVVVEATDVDAFIAKAEAENLEAYAVATVTESPRMVLRMGETVVADLSRAFLSSNGAVKRADAAVPVQPVIENSAETRSAAQILRDTASDLRYASQRGMAELFDASVGAGTVIAPYGGKTQRTPAQVMAATVPVQHADTPTCAVMAFGFDPYLSEKNPYTGAQYAVVTSVAKLVAVGVDPDKAYLSFQEYFERLRNDATRWGKPLSALLGALDAQMGLELAAIGGKDSMSGSFEDMDVPPTLVSFAVAPSDARTLISPEFKSEGRDIVVIPAGSTFAETKNAWRTVHKYIGDGAITAAWALTEDGGIAEAVTKMSFGYCFGAELDADTLTRAFPFGSIVAETDRDIPGALKIGRTIVEPMIVVGSEIVEIAELLRLSESTLEPVFPTRAEHSGSASVITHDKRHVIAAQRKFTSPRAVVLAFPGTNSEIDTERALERAGFSAEIFVVRNLTPSLLRESVERCATIIRDSQTVVIPGGFSGGDEPDGSAKFITAFFRAPEITDAVHELLERNDGLMLGICNGFQALIKLGLVPFGRITPPDAPNMPTLTHNVIGRHTARYANIRVASVQSPWMLKSQVNDVYAVPLSHGEGRFVAPDGLIESLAASGQIATQYSDATGAPSMDIAVNANGSMCAVEGLFSPDGRVFGKMGHTERRGNFVGINIPGEKYHPLFESGAYYYK